MFAPGIIPQKSDGKKLARVDYPKRVGIIYK